MEATSLLLGCVRANVLQGADDVGGHSWGHGDILAAGPVAVSISSPGQLMNLSLGIGVGGHTVGHLSSQAALRERDAVGGPEVVHVGSVVVYLGVLFGDVGIAIDVSGRSQGDDGGDNQLGEKKENNVKLQL